MCACRKAGGRINPKQGGFGYMYVRMFGMLLRCGGTVILVEVIFDDFKHRMFWLELFCKARLGLCEMLARELGLALKVEPC